MFNETSLIWIDMTRETSWNMACYLYAIPWCHVITARHCLFSVLLTIVCILDVYDTACITTHEILLNRYSTTEEGVLPGHERRTKNILWLLWKWMRVNDFKRQASTKAGLSQLTAVAHAKNVQSNSSACISTMDRCWNIYSDAAKWDNLSVLFLADCPPSTKREMRRKSCNIFLV